MNNWICNLINSHNDRQLGDILLPGTHNSYCDNINLEMSVKKDYIYNINYNNLFFKNFKTIPKKWIINQSTNIVEQFDLGIRMFHLDISYLGTDSNACALSNYYTTNGYVCHRLANILQDFYRIAINNKDLFVIRIIPRYNMYKEQIEFITNYIFTLFTNIILNKDHTNNPLTCYIKKDILSKGRRIIIYWHGNKRFFNNYESNWLNTNESTTGISNSFLQLNSYVVKNKQNPNSTFFNLNWVLTPNKDDVINSIFLPCCYHDSLKAKTKSFNRAFKEFFYRNESKLCGNLNSISFDFVEQTTYPNMIIDSNYLS